MHFEMGLSDMSQAGRALMEPLTYVFHDQRQRVQENPEEMKGLKIDSEKWGRQGGRLATFKSNFGVFHTYPGTSHTHPYL